MIQLIVLIGLSAFVACQTTVEYSPKVLVEGCKAEFTCKNDAAATATWEWDKTGAFAAYDPAKTAKTLKTDALTLALNDKTMKCTVDGASGTKKMKVVANSDKSAKPKVLLPKTITAGASTVLTCESPAACGAEMTYLWYKGDAKVQDQQGADVVTKELTITAPAAGKSEKYKCKSVAKSVENESAQVDVPPSSFGTKAAYSMMVLVLATFTGFLIKM